MANVIIFNIFLAASCGYALVRGGAPERIVAALLLIAAASTYIVQMQDRSVFHAVETDILLIDALLLIGLLLIALCADRFWPLWITGLHGLTLLVHAAKAYQPELIPLTYGLAVGKLAYPMLVLLVVGTRRHQLRKATYGTDNSWKGFSGRWSRSAPTTGPTS